MYDGATVDLRESNNTGVIRAYKNMGKEAHVIQAMPGIIEERQGAPL